VRANAQGWALARSDAEAEPPSPRNVATASPLRHGDRARAAMSRSQRDMGAHPVRWQPTHAHTHALEITPDQAEAARNPGDADMWARAVSRGKEKRR